MPEGIFATWQPEYAKHRLAIFPVKADKMPAIRGYLRVGLRGSEKLVRQFGSTSAFGIAVGRRTELTVLDIDRPDERLLQECLDRHGPTPIVIRTGSGNIQAWYRYNGESRLIRPHPDLPIDVLGSGFVVAPPSQTAAGRYSFLQGSLSDLPLLPTIQNLDFLQRRHTAKPLPVGERNRKLFRYALQQARHVDNEETLLDVVQTENEYSCDVKLNEAEIIRLTKSAWGYEEEGRNLANLGHVPATYTEIDDLATEHPHALALLLLLRRTHTGRDRIILAKAFARRLKWSLPRFRISRQVLEDRGYIHCLHRGGLGKNDPPVYRLASIKPRPRD